MSAVLEPELSPQFFHAIPFPPSLSQPEKHHSLSINVTLCADQDDYNHDMKSMEKST
jgi:hypothetical protein